MESNAKPTKKQNASSQSYGSPELEHGHTVLDLYTIESYVNTGGMGHVYCVHHRDWKVKMAMKMYRDIKNKEAFEHECEHWIRLGLHPNIVSCYYVRDIDCDPAIFAEWMDGGSLRDWIYPDPARKEKEGRLYEGSEKEALRRILDISIETARGLHYAHEKGLVHQDVKPENLLLTADGQAKVLTAKVADFGIADAKAKIAGADDTQTFGSDTIVVNGRAYTRQYCSPEQKSTGEPTVLTRRTDIWSWAATVLEMFMGYHPWMDGSIIGWFCKDYFKVAKIPVPEAMRALLIHCFQKKESKRPHDFKVIEGELLEIYRSATGQMYPRPEAKAASLVADSLNNHALSFIDLGKTKDAEKYWEEALKLDPNSTVCQYNYGIHLWKTARIDDMEAIRRLNAVSKKDVNYYDCLAKLHMARSDAESAIKCINEAIAIYGETEELNKKLSEAYAMTTEELDGRCIRVMKEHTNHVYAVCFSPDLKLALSGGKDRKAKVWNIETGECIRTLEGHTHWVASVCFSPDGRLALAGGFDKTIKGWSLETGKCIYTLKNSTSKVNAIRYNPDGSPLSVTTIPVETDIFKVVYTDNIDPVDYCTEDELILSGIQDSTVKIWSIKTGRCIRTLEGHAAEIYAVSFSPNGKQALSGGMDNTLKLWNIATGECIHTLKGHLQAVLCVCFGKNGRLALSGSHDRTVKIWNLETGKCIRTLEKHQDTVRSVCISADGKLALSGGHSGEMKLWRIPVEQPHEPVLSRIKSPEKAIKESEQFHSFVTDIEQLISQKEINEALYQLNKLKEIQSFTSGNVYYEINGKLASYCISHQLNSFIQRELPHVNRQNWDFYWSKNDFLALIGYFDATVNVWNPDTCQCIRSFKTDTFKVEAACFSPDGRLALSGSDDGAINLWDISTGECLHHMKAHAYNVNSVCISPDSRWALTGSADKTIKLWDIETGACIRKFESSDVVLSVCFSPDGKQVLSGGGDSKEIIELWDIATGNRSRAFKGDKYFEGHPYYVNSVCFSPDGMLILSGGADDTVKLWNVVTGECIQVFKGHTNTITSVSISPDGKKAISGSWDRTVKLWDMETADCLHNFDGFTDWIDKISFSPDGRTIVAATKYEIHVYTLDYEIEFPGWKNWDERASKYLDLFLIRHPDWTDDDFDNILIPDLQNRGYGWLRPEGVRIKLNEISNNQY